MRKIILFILVSFCCLAIGYAQPGKLDPSFGTNGIVRADLGATYDSGQGMGRQVLLLPDRSIYIICQLKNETLVAKRLPNGTPDFSYGINGFSNPVSMREGRGAIQSDGKIVVAGKVGESEADLVRFNTDGTLDLSFSEDGKLVIATDYDNSDRTGAFFQTNSVAIQKDGKIVVLGTTATGDFAVSRYNPDGSLDKSFSDDGRQTTDFGYNDISYSVAIQGDGKILVAGSARIGNSESRNTDFALARYNTDGSLDKTFSEDGKQTTDFSPSDAVYSYDYACSVIIQNDGKILLTGAAFDLGGLALARYNTDGSPDNSFSNEGKQITTISNGVLYGLSAAMQSNGKIVAAGYTYGDESNFDFAFVRYNTDGSLDNTFSNDGTQTTDIGTHRDFASSVAIQSDGKIVATGYTIDEGRFGFAFVRYNTNGSFDTEFNSGQLFVSIFPHGNTHFTKTAIQSDGKIVAAGYTWNGSSFVSILTRYNTDGSIDTTFNKTGILITGGSLRFGSPPTISSIVIQSDGKIVVVVPEYQEEQYSTAIVRYNKDGSLDRTFRNGRVTSSLVVSSIAIQSDGKIVAAGSIGYEEESDFSDFAVARYNTDGSLDKTFSNDGIQTTDFSDESGGYGSDGANSVVIQEDAKIVLIGSAHSQEHSEIAIARYNTNGSLDNTFSDDGMLTTEIAGYLDEVFSAALQSNGKIAVAGRTRYDDERSALYVALYNSDGSLYRVFKGFNSTDYMNYSIANSIAIQSDDKILIAGQYKGKSVLARLKKDGTLDSTFSNLGKQTVEEYIINDIAISNNKFYAVGYDADNVGVVARHLLEDDENTNKPPTVYLTIPYNIVKYSAPARIKLNATATDEDGKITKVQFYNGSTLLHTEDVSPYGFLWTDVPQGDYTLTAKAFDNSGNVTTSSNIHVSVTDENVPPVVSIVSPVNDTTYTGPATIRLIAIAKDPNDRISKVEFYNGTTIIRTEYYYPYTYTWTNVQPGTYTVTAKAYDDKGLSTTSEPVTVTVNASSLPIVKSRPFVNNQTDINGVLSMKLSPVPAASTLQISTQGLHLDKPSTISIISASGVLLKTIQSNTSNKVVRLDVSSLVRGAYTIKVVSGDRMVYKQFVKL